MTVVRIGDIEVFALSDARLTAEPTRSFPGSRRNEWREYQSLYPSAFTDDDTWHNNVGAFCLRTDELTVIVDTGIGPGPVEDLGGGQGSLPRELQRIDVPPTDVDIVFFTHLHLDHIGWTMVADSATEPLFANARHLVHRADWEHFAHPKSGPPNESILKSILPLAATDHLELLGGDTPIAAGLDAFHTPGHTPGHMSLLVSSRGQDLFISGDLIHHPAQVDRHQWSHRADLEPSTSEGHRVAWLDQIERRGGLWATGHFPPPSIGYLSRSGSRRVWQPVRPES